MRRPDFEAIEFGPILHVLADRRMTIARKQVMEPRTRNKLYTELINSWTDHIAPFFNDESFQRQPVNILAEGLTKKDIMSMNPARRPYDRDAGTLNQDFGELKSQYRSCSTKFEASGPGDFDAFVFFANGKSYVPYSILLFF